jgi:hypothetical protein
VKATYASLVVLGTALALYLWRPHAVPPGYFVDEPSVALNAACIAAAGSDEYGTRWPLFFRAFDEYKLPAFVYTEAALFAIVHPTLLVGRLLSMTLGLFAFAVWLALVRAREPEATRSPWFTALAASFCLLSPWLLVIARFAVECSMVPLVAAAQLWTADRLLRSRRLGWAVADGALVGFGVYVYHPLKIIPLGHFAILGAVALWRCRRDPHLCARVALAAVTATAIMVPFLLDMFGAGHSLARFRLVRGHADLATLLRLYFVHMNGTFLFLRGDHNLRHHLGVFGELALVFLPLVVAGVVECVRCSRHGDLFALYVLLLVPCCFVPASLSDDGVPHALRSNVALVPLWTLAFYGYLWCRRAVAARPRPAVRAVAGAALALGLVQVLVIAILYQTDYPRRAAGSWASSAWLGQLRAHPPDVPVANHSGHTIFARFFRVADAHDYKYCRPPSTD